MTPPLVLVPGTLCDERVFAAMATGLDAETVCAPPVAQADVESAAAALLAVAPRQFIVAGFSLGGFVVLELLRQASDRLAGAVLIASHALPLGEGQAEARRRDVAVARARGMAAVIDGLWPRYVSERNRNNEALRREVVAMAEAVGPDLFARQTELAITRPDSRDTVRDTAVPLLVLCGQEDGMCPPDRCGAAAGGSVRLRMLPGVGHFIPLEAPTPAARAIAEWAGEVAPCC